MFEKIMNKLKAATSQKNTLLASLLKNWINELPEDQRLIYEKRFRELYLSESIDGQIAILLSIIIDLDNLNPEGDIGEKVKKMIENQEEEDKKC